MSLKAQAIPVIPEETERVPRGAFQKRNIWIGLREELGVVLGDCLEGYEASYAQISPRRSLAMVWSCMFDVPS